LLAGKTPADWRTDFLYQFKWSSEVIPASEGVCSKDWKYINWIATGTEELFDLRSDAHEVRDLSRDPGAAAEMTRMRARLVELRAEVGGTPTEKLVRIPVSARKPDNQDNP